MRNILLFENFGQGSFTQELPNRVTLPPGGFGFVELSDSDTGDRMLGIINGSELDYQQDLLDNDFIAAKILKCLEEGKIISLGNPAYSYHVRTIDQNIIKGKKEIFVSFFTQHSKCEARINDVLM